MFDDAKVGMRCANYGHCLRENERNAEKTSFQEKIKI